MRYEKINSGLFIRNREKLKKKVKSNSLVIVNSNDELPRTGDQTFSFRQNSDLFYLTGLEQEKCILCLCPAHPKESLREIVFSIKPDETMEGWLGHKFTKEEIIAISGIKTVKWLDEFDKIVRELIIYSEYIYLNINENIGYSPIVPSREVRFTKQIIENFPCHKYERLAPLLKELRLIKEPEEVGLIKTACKITENAFLRVLHSVKPGIREFELEAEIIHEFLKNGCNGGAYMPIVASGANTCSVHYCRNDGTCREGDLLLLDLGAEYANYAADCSRTIPVNGKFSKRQSECYNAVLKIFKKAKTMLVPGTTIEKINKSIGYLFENELVRLG
ncbi:MAG: aminopeptidase P N-terminal domain-containing protein, partial [Bacteroidia bacterium]|nr:aminopeptidase P N-terminal domain-containing protein [Bacteroidia bacterium]